MARVKAREYGMAYIPIPKGRGFTPCLIIGSASSLKDNGATKRTMIGNCESRSKRLTNALPAPLSCHFQEKVLAMQNTLPLLRTKEEPPW